MANQTSVYVKAGRITDGDNKLFPEIKVLRKPTADCVDLNKTVGRGNGVESPLLSRDAFLEISVPGLEDTRDCPIKITSAVDLLVSYSRIGWTVRIASNDSLREGPTEVTINVGDEEPESDEEETGKGNKTQIGK
ncbi:MAG: hypothetical protein GY757_19630 [bacterium]|nr:hypothetical protein [bacterium]